MSVERSSTKGERPFATWAMLLALSLPLLLAGGPVGAEAATDAGDTGPANDQFAEPEPLSGREGQAEGSNVDATVEVGEPDPFQGSRATVWWSWTAPADSEVRFDTHGSGFDTWLGIYAGDALAGLETVAVNDASGDATGAAVTFEAIGGERYHIQVGGPAGATGQVRLNWGPDRWEGPANDDRVDGVAVGGTSGSVEGSNVDATVEHEEADPFGEASHSVWWSWSAPEDGPFTFEAVGDGFEPVLGAFRDVDGALTEEAVAVAEGTGTTTLSFEAAEGETYAIQLDGSEGQTGDVQLSWEPMATTDAGISAAPSEAFSTIPASADTGEKPQSKVWRHAGSWWAVLPSTQVAPSGTWVWRLDPDGWRNVLHLDPATNAKADVKRVGDVAHVALRVGSTAGRLVSIEHHDGAYRRWSARNTTTSIALTNSETFTIDIDSTGRMWLATDANGLVHAHHSAYPYTAFSAPITLASGLKGDDIAVVTAMPDGRVGVLWSNQNTQRFGFRVRNDGDPVGTWRTDEVPASGSALSVGGGMADDHLNLAVASDGTLYAAIKTSYDKSGYVTIGLLVRGTNGTWDPLHTVDTSGTRGIVTLNEETGSIHVVYNSSTGYHDVRAKTSPRGQIGFGPRTVAMSGQLRDVTSTKETWSDNALVMASTSGAVAHHAFLGAPPSASLTADPGSLSVPQDGTASGTLTASNTSGGPLSFSIVTPPTKGSTQITNAGAGTYTYTAGMGQTGSDSFRFRVTDGSNIAEADVSVAIVASPPGDDPPEGPDVSGAVGVWRFDEGTGTAVRDASGSGNHGSFVGNPTWVAGRFGSALRVDSGNHALVPTSQTLDIRGPITIATWVRPERIKTQSVVHKASGTAGYELSLASDGRPFVRFNGSSKARVNATSQHPSDGQTWMHLAATYDGSTTRLYVDGVLEASGPGPAGGILTAPVDLGLGASAANGNPLRGAIDDLHIFDRALSTTEIAGLASG
jgi:large repetitive protein